MSVDDLDDLTAQVRLHASTLWPDADDDLPERLIEAIGIRSTPATGSASRWNERDVMLITYGDSILDAGSRPLDALHAFVSGPVRDAVGTVHILPFSPYSSDRGFSVIDYDAVDPALGSWADIEALGGTVDLMFDLVINHISSQSAWGQQFRDAAEPGRSFIRVVADNEDTSSVVRPRSLPLLTEVETREGPRNVWTTFSADQFDLDWRNPNLAVAMFQVINRYVEHGARFLRLDAIAYVGKVSGTKSIHLPQTHELVRLMHTLLSVRAPEVALITETNVPDFDNRSYFGVGDEAHMVYNFTLPPLLVDGILHERAERLASWLRHTTDTPPGTTLFNFMASHDGIGVRPAEGMLSDHEIERLVEIAHERGGRHGTYDTPSGPRPYELNISLPDLFGGMDDPFMPARVLLVHDVMFSLAGIPAVFVNSLVATTNDHEAVDRDHVRRSINRGSVSLAELDALDGARREILEGLTQRMINRRADPTCHPDAAQEVRHVGPVLIVERTTVDGSETRTFLHNFAPTPQQAEGVTLAPYESKGV
ncbi:MAG: alpha-amylase [Acidimicrobiales bacterium]|nr:alpha-amylase [Acidimicrobiales bacterium]RZV48058.1 MAG: alpha-amylase [Acidimicrobiales bacterium]